MPRNENQTVATLAQTQATRTVDEQAQAAATTVQASRQESGIGRTPGQADAVSLLAGDQRGEAAGPARPIAISPSGPAGAAPQAEPGPADRAIAQQVARSVLAELPNGDRILQLRLTPPELGTVRVQIIEHQGQLQIRMSAEDDGVRHALERALPHLRQDLRSHDAPVADLQMAENPFFDMRREQDPQQRSGRGGRRGGPTFSLDGIDETPAVASASRTGLGGSVSESAVNATA